MILKQKKPALSSNNNTSLIGNQNDVEAIGE